MSAAMREGYKQTEVGVIPENWESKRLDELGLWKGGVTPSMQNQSYWSNGNLPWISSGDVKTVLLKETGFSITPFAVKQGAATLLPPNSIVMVTRSGILRKYLPVEMNVIQMAINQDIKALIPTSKYSPTYLLHALIWSGDRIMSRCLKAGTTVESIEFPWLKAFVIPVAPLPEQRAIAAALSDVDALLAKLDALVTKKRDLKQAAMHQLLTGLIRLPGFSAEWERRQFFEICYMRSGEGITSADIDNHSKFPCYGGNGLRGYATRYTHEGTYALIGRQGALCGNVLTVNGQFFASEHAIVVTPFSGINIQWLAVVLERMNLNQYSESSAQPGLSVSRLLSFSTQVPAFEEQAAIATVLTDMDAELTALEARRHKTRALKQGMMQELLTGRIRLV